MGSGRDKRKKAKGKAPGQGEQKTTKKTEKNEDKAERRAAKILEASLTHDDHADCQYILLLAGAWCGHVKG